ncbi:MAG: hypothetical protein OD815_000571 [Candidatus Alkanophagales archaeon MCA70_species_2]|nr:hypothetical protein [Candidatus Alkanophaga liquidiphilum]
MSVLQRSPKKQGLKHGGAYRFSTTYKVAEKSKKTRIETFNEVLRNMRALYRCRKVQKNKD